MSDILDAALSLEEAHFKQGRDEGFAEGVVTGEAEGREVGLKAGFELGEELGFYTGCIQLWLALIAVDPSSVSTRAKNSIQELQRLVQAYPHFAPEDETLQDRLSNIRSKFRVVSSQLGIRKQDLTYTGQPTETTNDALF